MKKTFVFLNSLILFSLISKAQTNTFPSSGNVGIGTTSPITTLDITGTNKLYVNPNYDANIVELSTVNSSNTAVKHLYINAPGGKTFFGGYLGIGTTNPVSAFDVTGTNKLYINPNYDANTVELNTSNAAFNAVKNLYINSSGGKTFFGGYLGIGTTNPICAFDVTGANKLYVNPNYDANTVELSTVNIANTAVKNLYINSPGGKTFFGGNVGIGTTTPLEKLSVDGNISVNGDITGKKLTVTQTPWSDYVFAKDYKLRSLSSLETFINQHQHLPEVPTAEEVATKGISVGDNQALLLKKIEELTLYIIDLQKQVNELKNKK